MRKKCKLIEIKKKRIRRFKKTKTTNDWKTNDRKKTRKRLKIESSIKNIDRKFFRKFQKKICETFIKTTKRNSFWIKIEKKRNRNEFAICCHETKNSKKKKHEENKTKSKTQKHNKFKTIFQNREKKKIVDSNMNFMNENIFQKRLQIMNDEFFFLSFRSLSSISINFYKKTPSNVDALNFSKSSLESASNIEALNSLNFFELNFQLNFQLNLQLNSQSTSDRRDVLIFRFRIFNLRINFRNQNIQLSSFESSFAINRHRAKLKYIASENIFIRSQNSFSRSSFFFQSLFSRSSFFDRKSLTASFSTKIKTLFLIASLNSTYASINFKIIMFTNFLRRKQFIKIKIFEKNEQTNVKNLYRKKLFDILNTINDARNQISPSVLRKINKIVKNLKKKKPSWTKQRRKKTKQKKRKQSYQNLKNFSKKIFISNFERSIFENEKCWNLTFQFQNFLSFSWSRIKKKKHKKTFF